MDANGVVDAMFAAGWTPALGIRLMADGKVSPNVDPIAKTNAINFYDTALAICYAESNFDPSAKSDTSSAVGLWQILSKLHAPMVKEEIDRWSVELNKKVDLTNPIVNSACANRLWQARGWQPWETYTKTSSPRYYRQYLGKGKAGYARAVQNASDPKRLEALKQEFATGKATAQVIAGTLTPADNAASLAGWVAELLTGIASMASTVGIFILGLLLLIVGLWLAAGSPNITPMGIAKKVALS